MKKLAFFFVIIYNSLNSFGQNVTVDELAKLRKSSFALVEETLSSKGWTFLNGSDPSEENFGSATFAYGKNSFSDEAVAFLSFNYDNSEGQDICSHRISLEFFNKEKYNLYLSRLKSLGCKLVKSTIENGNITKIYQGQTTTFLITIVADRDSFGGTTTRYQFLIVGNVDYFIVFDDDPTLRNLLKEAVENKQ